MKIVFRADSSLQIGTGHVMRCRTLAKLLRKRGADISFICRGHEGHLGATLANDGFAVRILEAPARPLKTADRYASWLGVEEDQDARETLTALGDGADVLVVDHYGLSAAWEKAMRGAIGKILAIDDLGRQHDTDILLDQNYSQAPEVRYAGRISESCVRLLGPRFALLQPEYATLAASTVSREGPVRRVFLFFGGADSDNVTALALDALFDKAFEGLTLDVAIGTANPNAEAITRMVKSRPNTELHKGLSLAGFMATADLALGAGGVTMWERCAAGLPSIVVSIAENQVPGSRDLGAAGIIHYLGTHEEVRPEALREAVRNLINDPPRRHFMAEQGRLLVDGQGARRVAEVVMPSPSAALTLRLANAADCGFCFQLANDPDVRRQSFSRDAITWEGHKRWYEAKMNNPLTRLYVLEAGGLAVGQIRFDDHGGRALLSYSLDRLARGRGWGSRLVEMGLRRLAVDAPRDVLAEVRLDNTVSRITFDKLGFEKATSQDRSSHSLSREKLTVRFV